MLQITFAVGGFIAAVRYTVSQKCSLSLHSLLRRMRTDFHNFDTHTLSGGTFYE